MRQEEAIPYLARILTEKKRHKHYNDEVELATLCRQLLGDTEDQKDLILQFSAREDEEQRKQRIKLTNSVTRSVLSPALAYIEELVRTDGIKEVVDSNAAAKDRIKEHFKDFYRGESLFRYCFEAAKYAAKLDPNYWTVFNYKTTRNAANNATAITDIYPIEVPCKNVLDYGFDETGRTMYLAFETTRKATTREGKEIDTPDNYLFGIGYVLNMIEVKPDVVLEGVENYQTITYERKTYLYNVIQNRTIEVPAIRWAAYLSDIHDNEIGAPIFYDAIPLLKSLIRDVSFFDLHKVLHLRAEKFMYVKQCDDVDEESGAECEGGYYGGVRSKDRMCKRCGGSGKVMPLTEQAVITLAWPERQEEVFNLASLTHYAERPINLIEFFRTEIERLSRQVMLAVYSQQAVDAANLMSIATATQASIEYDKINNKLAPIAALIEKAFELAWRVAFQYYGATGEVMLSFPQDFKLQSIDGLIAQYNAAKGAGLPYEVLQSIRSDILKKQYRNSPEQVMFAEALEKHRPFKTKSVNEIGFILQTRAENDPDRQVWENWDEIANELENETVPFYLLDFQTQRNRIREIAARIASEIIRPEPQMEPGFNIADLTGGLPEDLEEEEVPTNNEEE